MGNNGSNYGNHNQMFDSMMPEQFIGEMKDNHRNGKGTFIYSNGDRYEGNWLNDLRHGKGTFYYKTGELYIGEWLIFILSSYNLNAIIFQGKIMKKKGLENYSIKMVKDIWVIGQIT